MGDINTKIEMNEREERIIREWAGELTLAQIKRKYMIRFTTRQMKQWCDLHGVHTCSKVTFPTQDRLKVCRVCGKIKTENDFPYVQIKRRDICNECCNARRRELKNKKHGA